MIWEWWYIPAYFAIGLGLLYIVSFETEEFDKISEEPGLIGLVILLWPLAPVVGIMLWCGWVIGYGCKSVAILSEKHRKNHVARLKHLENVAK